MPTIRNLAVKGWHNWVTNLNTRNMRLNKRHLAAKILGGLCIKNPADDEILATKIRNLGLDMALLEKPFATSLKQIASLEFEITQVMGDWFKSQQQNDHILLSGLNRLQEEIAWTIACTQTQAWVSSVNSEFLKEGWSRTIPIEMKRLLK